MMKKLVTLLLTVALCMPMFMTTSIEVRAEDSEPTEPTETYDCAHSYAGCDGKVDTEGAVCEECVRNETPVYNQFELEGVKKHDVIYKCSKDGCDYVFETSSTECTYTSGACVCGRTEDVEPDEPEEDNTKQHFLLDNKCISCGYVSTCEHTNISKRYACVEANKHETIAICDSCTSQILNLQMIDDCTFDENNICTLCNTAKTTKPSNSVPTPTPAPSEEQISESIAKATEEKIKVEEAIPVEDFVSEEAVNAIPAEVKGNTSTEEVFNISKITTTRGFVAAVDKIVKENSQETSITLYSDKPFAFNTTSLDAVANASKDFVYTFKHEGQLYKVTIPAGAKVDLEGQMFAGPLYIGAKLGTTTVVK